MRLLLVVALALASVACRAPLIQNLPLAWTGVDAPARPSPSVSHALASVPISFALRDVRPDPSVVGQDQATGHIVRTSDVVGQFASTTMGDLLRAAGARLDEAPVAIVETDLSEFNVVESGRFNASVAIRVSVSRGGAVIWSKGFRGKSSTWGKSHSPANFNKALSNALDEATEQLLQDEEFAGALLVDPGQLAPPPPAPPAPMPPSAAPPGI